MIDIIIIILLIILIVYNISICVKEGFDNDSCTPIPANKLIEMCNNEKDDYDALFLEKETKINKINSLINNIYEKQSALRTDMCPESMNETIDEGRELIENEDVEVEQELDPENEAAGNDAVAAANESEQETANKLNSAMKMLE